MRVYYLTAATFGLSNLALRRLKVSRFSELNDPFELLAVDSANPDLREAVQARKGDVDGNEGLVCFSRGWRNPLLWSHYGEKHRGMCLGFDVPDANLTKVIYRGGLRKIAQHEIEDKIRLLQRTKFRGWSYEQEERMFVDLRGMKPQSGLFFIPFSTNLALREVILGPKCELPISEIRELARIFEPPVFVVGTRIAYTKFAVVEDRTLRGTDRK